jgi:hypothetical protein
VKFTFPRSPKDGKARVAKDIQKIIKPINGQWFEAKDVLNLPDDIPARMIKTKSGAVYLVDIDLMRPNASIGDIESYHNSKRGARGRVTTAGGGSDVGRNTLDVGRWKIVSHMHVNPKTLRQYIKMKQARVGKAKSGWAPGAEYFARLTGGRSGVPAFASSAKHGVSGTWVDTFSTTGNGYGVIANTVPYVSHPGSGAVQIAMKVTRTYLEKVTKKQVEKIAQRFNSLGSGRAAA